jgi:hypothetical protein
MEITMRQLHTLLGRSCGLIGDEGELEFTQNPWYGDNSGHTWLYANYKGMSWSGFELRESDEIVEIHGRSVFVLDSEGDSQQITPVFTVELAEYIDRHPL